MKHDARARLTIHSAVAKVITLYTETREYHPVSSSKFERNISLQVVRKPKSLDVKAENKDI